MSSSTITPFSVRTLSVPRESGATSRRSKFYIDSGASPERIPAQIAAPYATASSAFILVCRVFPSKNSWTIYCTLGMREDPPIMTTSSIQLCSSCASVRTSIIGRVIRFRTVDVSSSNYSLVNYKSQSSPQASVSISIQ